MTNENKGVLGTPDINMSGVDHAARRQRDRELGKRVHEDYDIEALKKEAAKRHAEHDKLRDKAQDDLQRQMRESYENDGGDVAVEVRNRAHRHHKI